MSCILVVAVVVVLVVCNGAGDVGVAIGGDVGVALRLDLLRDRELCLLSTHGKDPANLERISAAAPLVRVVRADIPLIMCNSSCCGLSKSPPGVLLNLARHIALKLSIVAWCRKSSGSDDSLNNGELLTPTKEKALRSIILEHMMIHSHTRNIVQL